MCPGRRSTSAMRIQWRDVSSPKSFRKIIEYRPLSYWIIFSWPKLLAEHAVIEQRNGLVQLSSVQSLSHVQLFATPWTAARQASLSITNSWSLLRVMSVELVMPFNHLILCQMASNKRNRNLLLNPTPTCAELGRASLELVGHRQNEVVPQPCGGKEMQRWNCVH